MTAYVIHQLAVPAKANLRSKLGAQRGCSQNGGLMSASHQFAVSAQANPAQPVLSAQRSRSQNRPLARCGLNMAGGTGGHVFGSGVTFAALTLACTENMSSTPESRWYCA